MNRLILHRSIPQVICFALLTILSFSLVLGLAIFGWSPAAQGQLLPPDGGNDALNPPSIVSRYGEYETVPIRSPLDNSELFELTSPTIFDRDKVPEGKLPVEIRAGEVSERLWRVFQRTISTKQTPTVMISTLNNRPILEVQDDQSTRPVRLVTITEPDADFNGKTLNELAAEWQKILQSEIVRFKQLTRPETLLPRLGQAFLILLGLLIASAVI